jgi:hypothetical protein
MADLPVAFSWSAVQEKVALGKEFTFSTAKAGYAVESSPISGLEISRLLASDKYIGQRLWLSVTGETLRGALSIGLLNRDGSKFSFIDRLPSGKWHYLRQVELTPDLSQFTILFNNNAGIPSTVRIESVRFVAFPTNTCWTPGARITADYSYVGQKTNLGGFSLPQQAGLATYYFPQAFFPPSFHGGLEFSDLKVDGISPDCITDWSIARNFPAGTPPAELLLIDGKLRDFQRGDWASIWRNFID